MFLDEARLAARLNHPNVVQTYEVGEDGEPLLHRHGVPRGPAAAPRSSQRVEPHGDSRSTMHLRILADVLAGLHHAHELARLRRHAARRRPPRRQPAEHVRHLRRAGEGGRLRHRQGGRSVRAHPSRRAQGQGPYMAPEQARGEPVDARADVFAVGVMLWEAIAGRRIAGGEDRNDRARAPHGRKRPAILEAVPDAPTRARRDLRSRDGAGQGGSLPVRARVPGGPRALSGAARAPGEPRTSARWSRSRSTTSGPASARRSRSR